MEISQHGLELVTHSEGWRSALYLDQAGHPTIGYGHLVTHEELASNRFGWGLTPEEGLDLLRKDLREAEVAVLEMISVPLTQGQFDALVDFVFNLGANALRHSTLRRRLNAGVYEAVPPQLVLWCHYRDPATRKLVESSGLLKRRQREVQLWQTGQWTK